MIPDRTAVDGGSVVGGVPKEAIHVVEWWGRLSRPSVADKGVASDNWFDEYMLLY